MAESTGFELEWVSPNPSPAGEWRFIHCSLWRKDFRAQVIKTRSQTSARPSPSRAPRSRSVGRASPRLTAGPLSTGGRGGNATLKYTCRTQHVSFKGGHLTVTAHTGCGRGAHRSRSGSGSRRKGLAFGPSATTESVFGDVRTGGLPRDLTGIEAASPALTGGRRRS